MTENPITYTVIKRRGQRRLIIRVKPDNTVVVSCPKTMTDRQVAEFVDRKADWIRSAIEKNAKKIKENNALEAFTDNEIKQMKKKAQAVIPPLCEFYAEKLGVKYKRIFYKTQSSIWGSCSAQKNLNFNVCIMKAPENVIRYLVVHELCHLKEMNHSPKFWAHVGKVIPDFEESKKWLQKDGKIVIRRLEKWKEGNK